MNPVPRLTWIGLLALGSMLAVFALRPWLLERAEYALLDWRFRLRGEEPIRSPVLVVAIDRESIDEIGRWPWSRDVVAQLIDRLSEGGARAIGLDLLFSESETPPSVEILRDVRRALERRLDDPNQTPEEIDLIDGALERVDTDARLADAIRRSGRVALGYFFRTGIDEHGNEENLNQALTSIRRARFSIARTPIDSNAPILTCTDLEANLPVIQQAGRRSGFFSAIHDEDGVMRRAALAARCQGEFYMSLTLATYELAMGVRSRLIGDTHRLISIEAGDRVFPVDEGGRVLIDYRGPKGTVPSLSAADVLAGRLPDDAVRGAIVLVGPTEVGLRDTHPTPFGVSTPGVEIHANVLDNLISGHVIRRHDGLLVAELLLLIGSCLVLIFIVPRTSTATRAALSTLVVASAVLAGGTYAFLEHNLWINITYPLVGVGFVYLALEVARSVSVEATNRRTRRMFATYVPPEVVEELTQNQESFELGGERRDLSILFSDVRDFTTLSEELGAEKITRLMNVYLTSMTQIIFDSRGTLDKYIGDAVVAFWGAPLPVEDHPVRACESALAMQDEITRLRHERRELPGSNRLFAGIGIHSAEVVVGNLGSELRFDYTMTGDGVNFCSRLEGLTKFYGINGILASDDLRARLPDGFLAREIDEIRVKGRRGAMRIHQILGRRTPESQETVYLDAYAQGLGAYREGRFDAASSHLREALAASEGEDGPSRVLLTRCESLIAEPPTQWSGIWSFDTK
ncbi:adenylate/guanylate cyclase domain-containing protein [Myxococcota bacterium]|nr:adenylate/guanylate cyclase domain-containing protein [Myxococcota bacterium]